MVDEERILCLQRVRALLGDMMEFELSGKRTEALTRLNPNLIWIFQLNLSFLIFRLKESAESLEKAASWKGGNLDAEVWLLRHTSIIALLII